MSAGRFSDRVALITGGASGIGAATARRLAAEGAKVVVLDLDEEGVRLIAKEIEGEAIVCDVADVEAVRAAVAQAEELAGPIDILVNNAGTDRFAFFVNTDEQTWRHVIDVNLVGTIACTHAVLPGMYARRRGVVVNVASEAGRSGTIAGAIYSASKAGVLGFTKAIARESARYGIRCNAVAPGPIDTPLLNGSAEAAGDLGGKLRFGMIASTTMQRVGQPEEVAAAIAYVASDEASYTTGETMAVNGGLSMI
jgi:2-hydroxycyclohexanecarboxyl-CoA dehydrogenase